MIRNRVIRQLIDKYSFADLAEGTNQKIYLEDSPWDCPANGILLEDVAPNAGQGLSIGGTAWPLLAEGQSWPAPFFRRPVLAPSRKITSHNRERFQFGTAPQDLNFVTRF
jgi:hypothetical protein